MIELIEGLWIDVWEVRAIKAIGKEKCSLFLSGMGAMDGYLIPYPAEEVVDAVLEAREGNEEEQEEDE